MPQFGVALAWMVVSPLAVITDIISIIVLLHYKPCFHSCDVALISIFVTMATSSALLIPVPAVIRLGGVSWTRHLCLFYTWLAIALRTSHLLVLLVLNVYWVASLRMSPTGRMFMSAKPMKASVGACWLVAVLAGLPTVAGSTELFPVFQNDVCHFLPANVHVGYAIFFILLSLVSVIMGFISTLDTLLVLRSMREAATSRCREAGILAPTFSGAAGGRSEAHGKYNELCFSTELCRLVMCFSLMSAAMDAFPLLVSQFMELTLELDLDPLEVTLLWLLLAESLTLPHVLWVLSRRYRHAAAYTWRVFVLRDRGALEPDANACILQAFRVKVKDSDDMHRVRSSQTNGPRPRPSIPELNSYIAEHRDDEQSTTNDSQQSDADDSINMAAMDNELILSAPMAPADIVLHEDCGQGFSNINSQRQNTSFLPRSQGRTAGPTDAQCTMFAVSDTPLSHTSTYTSSHTPLTTFTYDSGKQVETASRNQTRKSNEQNSAINTDILFDTSLDYTGRNTVSREYDDCARCGVSTICDNLNAACFHKTVLHTSCSCCHTATQQSPIYVDCLDCMNTECTHTITHKLYLAQGLQKASTDANKDRTLIGESPSVPAHLIVPSRFHLDNLLSRNHTNNAPDLAHPTRVRRPACCGGNTFHDGRAMVSGNGNTVSGQQKPYILVQKFTLVLGVYYDDTHTVENKHV
ncbi:hypothetical protein BsWGS_26465 [Bradybaena similaris]